MPLVLLALAVGDKVTPPVLPPVEVPPLLSHFQLKPLQVFVADGVGDSGVSLGVAVPRGAVYYGATRRRYEVVFDEALRERTLELVEAIRAMLIAQQLPAAPNDQRCRNCSLIHACLPGVVGQRERLLHLQRVLYQPLS